MNALRGHSNIQGLTDLGLMSNLHPGLPDAADATRSRISPPIWRRAASSRCARTRPATGRTIRSSSSASRRRCTARRRRRRTTTPTDWLPKLDVTYDILRAFELMHQGKINGYSLPGLQPADVVPQQGEDHRARWRS